MKFAIKSRWSSRVVCEVEIGAEWESRSEREQRGEAVRVALKSGSDLRGSDLRNSNLSGSDLSGSDLRGSNLSGSNLSDILAEVRVLSLHRKVLASINDGGRLEMSQWHGEGGACGTTHCRAGWYVFHAGAPGRVLEVCMGTPAAAALIYLVSCKDAGPTPDFYASNEEALADIKRLAELEPAIG